MDATTTSSNVKSVDNNLIREQNKLMLSCNDKNIVGSFSQT